jgi:phenylacetaldehyde dehydrogenase
VFPAALLEGYEIDDCAKWWGPDRHSVIYYVKPDRSEIYFAPSQPEPDFTVESWPATGDVNGLAIVAAADAIFYNCTAASRLFAHKSIYDRVLEGIAAEAGKLKVGHGLDPSVNLGPLVSREQHHWVTGFLESARSEGAEVVTGGKVTGNHGYFVETSRDMRVVRQEISLGPSSASNPSMTTISTLSPNSSTTPTTASRRASGREISWPPTWMACKIKRGPFASTITTMGIRLGPLEATSSRGWGRKMGREVMEHYTETKSVAAKLQRGSASD